MSTSLKKGWLIILLSMPMPFALADATINAKIAATKAQMMRDFSPPKATQYLNATSSRRTLEDNRLNPSPSKESMATPTPLEEPIVPPSSSWYVQPGDVSTPSSNAPSSSGFNHNNLY